ncbi:MAG: hypothetical protein AAF567_05370 [Actinomycetota bacterium]
MARTTFLSNNTTSSTALGRSLRAVLVALAVTLIAAACGGSDGVATLAPTAADTGDSAPADTTTTDDGGDGAAPADDAEPTTAPEPTEVPAADPEPTAVPEPTTAPEPTDVPISSDADRFCVLYAENQRLADEFSPFDPVSTEEFITTSQQLLAEAIPVAPSDIQGDLRDILIGLQEIAALLEANEWSLIAISEQVDTLPSSIAADAASERIDAWLEVNCPDLVEPEVTEVDSIEDLEAEIDNALAGLLSTEAGRAFLIETLVADSGLTVDQATCFVENIDGSLLTSFANLDPNTAGAGLPPQLLAILGTCGIDPTALG